MEVKACPLTQLAIGGSGIVTAIDLPADSRLRLMEMGLLEGATVELVRYAPLGDPLEIKVRGYHLALRKRDAALITVCPVGLKGTASTGFIRNENSKDSGVIAGERDKRQLPLSKNKGTVVLTGNPNCGKTSIFNALTGLRAKVGNYPGVTVERKEGSLAGVPSGMTVTVLDLPGAYSLNPQSLDERIAHEVLLHGMTDMAPPDVVVLVLDASNLERNLYYATQVVELGYPTILALNMVDVAEANGHRINLALLSERLGVHVVPVQANVGEGIVALREAILAMVRKPVLPERRLFCELPGVFIQEIAALAGFLETMMPNRRYCAWAEALLLLSQEPELQVRFEQYSPQVRQTIAEAQQRLEKHGIAWRVLPIERRYRCITAMDKEVNVRLPVESVTLTQRLDSILTHRVWGLVIFAALMAIMFQGIFTLSRIPMDALEYVVNQLGNAIGNQMPAGPIHSLVEDGIVAGVGSVVVFLPQICLLFLFIGILEDSGYMARAAFIMDRLMSKVGLHGKSFIPMLSCFGCAIPGIMATRTIENHRDRLVTILVAPLVACSARLPVYTLLIAACIPDKRVWGILGVQGLLMIVMYVVGIVAALVMAMVFKRLIFKGQTPVLIMEMPPYKRPSIRALARHVWDRAWLFLQKAGTVILGINVLLWFLASYPKNSQLEADFAARHVALSAQMGTNAAPKELEAARQALHQEQASVRLENSLAGKVGKCMEPFIAPLGMDWRMGIGIVTSFAARESFVSTLSTVYSVEDREEAGPGPGSLADRLKEQKRSDGSPVYTPLMGVTIMVFYVFALQCASTIVMTRRETNSRKWAAVQWLYLGGLAWIASFIVYQGGRLLGF